MRSAAALRTFSAGSARAESAYGITACISGISVCAESKQFDTASRAAFRTNTGNGLDHVSIKKLMNRVLSKAWSRLRIGRLIKRSRSDGDVAARVKARESSVERPELERDRNEVSPTVSSGILNKSTSSDSSGV